jgi:cytochrome c5
MRRAESAPVRSSPNPVEGSIAVAILAWLVRPLPTRFSEEYMTQHEHSSFIKTWQQLVVVVVLSFLVPVLLILMIAQLVLGGLKVDTSNVALEPSKVAERIRPVASFSLVDASAPRVQQSGEAVYKAVCQVCHQAGVANAPKTGDRTAWAPLIKEGLPTILKDAIAGVRGMPPRGGNPDLSDTEMARAIVYMANLAGANWKEPEAPADAKPAAAAAPAAPAPAPVAAAPGALPAKVFFDTGKAGLTAAGQKTIEEAVATLKASATAQVDITGYTDKTGNVAQNLELAKQRAVNVRTALEKAGIPRDRINMRPPIETTGSGNDAEARRVEINLATAAAATPVLAAADKGEKGKSVYDSACFACHKEGVANAPKTGDKAAWGQRLKGGIDALYETSIKGKGAMPPKGGNTALADADVKAAVDYMVSLSK